MVIHVGVASVNCNVTSARVVILGACFVPLKNLWCQSREMQLFLCSFMAQSIALQEMGYEKY